MTGLPPGASRIMSLTGALGVPPLQISATGEPPALSLSPPLKLLLVIGSAAGAELLNGK
jgi:hypothetical protein